MDSVFHSSFFIRPRKKDEKEDILAYVLANPNWYFDYLKQEVPDVMTTGHVLPVWSKVYSYFPKSLVEEKKIKYFVIKLWTQSDLWELWWILHSSSGVTTIPVWSHSMLESYIGYYMDSFTLSDPWFRVHFFYMKREGMSSKDFILSTLRGFYQDCVVKEDIDISKPKAEQFTRLLTWIRFTGVTTSWSPLRPSDTESDPEAALKIEISYDKSEKLLDFLQNVVQKKKSVASVLTVEECKMVIKEWDSEKLLNVGSDENPLEDILVKLKAWHIMYGEAVRFSDFKDASLRFRDNPDSIPFIWYRLSDNS